MPDDFDEIAALPAKNEQMASVRVGFQRFLHQKCEARKAAPHIGVPRREPHAHARWNRNHRRASSAATIRARASTSTSVVTRIVHPPVSRISMDDGAGTGSDGGSKATGTNIGAAGLNGAALPPYIFLQRNSKLGLMPCRRATAEMFAQVPEDSATIDLFSALLHWRRVSATMANCREDLSPDIPTGHSPAGQSVHYRRHLQASAQGGLRRRDTKERSPELRNTASRSLFLRSLQTTP